MKMRTLLTALFVCAVGCEKSLETVSRAQTVEENTEAQNSLQIRYQYDGEWKTKSLYKEPIIIGRSDGVAIHVPSSSDIYVSRVHAKIWLENSRYWLEDLNSTNGTTVNSIEITNRFELREGDEIRIGRKTTLMLIKTEQ